MPSWRLSTVSFFVSELRSLGWDGSHEERLTISKIIGWVNRAFKTADALYAHVDKLAERIAKFEVNAVARAKQCVLRAEKNVVEDLIGEQLDFAELMKVGFGSIGASQ